MKGKDIFTKEEYEAIVRLLKSKVRSDKSGKKSIRAKIRKFGFHCSDFKNNAGDEFNVNDFKQLVKSGKITIIGGGGEKKMVAVGIFQKEINLCYQSGDSTKLMIRR